MSREIFLSTASSKISLALSRVSEAIFSSLAICFFWISVMSILRASISWDLLSSTDSLAVIPCWRRSCSCSCSLSLAAPSFSDNSRTRISSRAERRILSASSLAKPMISRAAAWAWAVISVLTALGAGWVLATVFLAETDFLGGFWVEP